MTTLTTVLPVTVSAGDVFATLGDAICALLLCIALGYAGRGLPVTSKATRKAKLPTDVSLRSGCPVSDPGATTPSTRKPARSATESGLSRDFQLEAITRAARERRYNELPRVILLGTRCDSLSINGCCQAAQDGDRFLVLLNVSLRACVGQRAFLEALGTYDTVSMYVAQGTGSIWSLLLFSAVEAGRLRRCNIFFERLCAVAAPADRDYVSMVRFNTYRRNIEGLQRILIQMYALEFRLPLITRNRALALCATKRAPAIAEMLTQPQACDHGLDATAYGLLVKVYARVGNAQKASEVLHAMSRDPSITESDVRRVQRGLVAAERMAPMAACSAEEALEPRAPCGQEPL